MDIKRCLAPLVLGASLLLVGCTPDELEITVYSSDIEAASKGESVEVPATVRFSMVGKDDRGNLQQASALAKRWLPADAKIEIANAQFGDKLIVETKVPMVPATKAAGMIQSQRPLIYLEVDGGLVTLRRTPHLEVLNRELRNLNIMLGAKLPARSTVFAVVGDRPPKAQTVEATAVFVNDRPVLQLKEAVVHRRTINIRFSGQDGSVYQDFDRIPPSIRLVTN